MPHHKLMGGIMARLASGVEVLKFARQRIVSAKTVAQLRQAQAVVLPLDCGLSIKKTAAVTGMTPGWVCQLRRRFPNPEVEMGCDLLAAARFAMYGIFPRHLREKW